jgi:hypothetical protein
MTTETGFKRPTSHCRRGPGPKGAVRQSPLPKIHIGMATCGIASGALETKAAFEAALAERGIEAMYTRWAVWATATPNRWWSSTIRIRVSRPFSTRR